MSPRSYQLGQRQVLTEQTRERILTATRKLLMTSNGSSGFSIEAVASLTVYHQFGSKIGLLEALCDSLALAGGDGTTGDGLPSTGAPGRVAGVHYGVQSLLER